MRKKPKKLSGLLRYIEETLPGSKPVADYIINKDLWVIKFVWNGSERIMKISHQFISHPIFAPRTKAIITRILREGDCQIHNVTLSVPTIEGDQVKQIEINGLNETIDFNTAEPNLHRRSHSMGGDCWCEPVPMMDNGEKLVRHNGDSSEPVVWEHSA